MVVISNLMVFSVVPEKQFHLKYSPYKPVTNVCLVVSCAACSAFFPL